ncbi:MAG: two-component system response regulator [Candidatus Limnocylindria bacterium]
MSRTATGPRRGLRALIVEDSERDAQLVLRRLDEAGYDVTWERVQTREAMAGALASPWDVVISDFGMPHFDAFAALDVLREAGQDLPFIVVSGTIGEDVAVECMRAGAHDFFLKGKLTRLPAAIDREIHEAELRRSERTMARSLEALHEIAFAAEGPADAERLALFSADRARQLLHADTAAVYRWDEAGQVLRLIAQRDDGTGVDVQVLAPGEGVSGAAFSRGEPVQVDDYAAPPPGIHPPVPGLTGSALAVPLTVGDRVFGTFYVRSHVAAPYRPEEVRTLQLLSAQVAPALAAAQLVEELRIRALHDPLTGLPNRPALRDALERALSDEAASGSSALLLADLDSFKDVNEALGREAGDDVLRQVAARLRAGVSERSFAAHLGADEFAVLLPGRDRAAAESVAERMLHGLDEPFSVEGQTVALTACVGVAVSPDHGSDPEVLLGRAEVALRSAKRSGPTFATYSPALEERTVESLALVGELRGAIERDELVMHYQRQVALATMRTVGHEALVRWQHPTRGLLAPAKFVSSAERSGLSRALFEWTLGRVLEDRSRAGPSEGQTVALNMSVRNLLDAELPRVIESALRRSNVQASGLVLEITEQGVMVDPDRAVRILERLRQIGIKLSIDDFGTGYSSMAYLQRLPVDELKIDRVFLHGIPTDRRNVSIVRATIDLARGLGISALAEGVEDETTLAALVTLGCERAQGYHLGRPLPAADALGDGAGS